jgi:hypothetical protein
MRPSPLSHSRLRKYADAGKGELEVPGLLYFVAFPPNSERDGAAMDTLFQALHHTESRVIVTF